MTSNTFSDKELNQFLEGDIDDDFTPDVSEKEALDEVRRAERHVAYLRKREEAVKLMQKYQDNPEKLWRVAYRWLMYSNADARKDVKAIIEECRQIRETRANQFARSRDINLRYGMRIPSIVLEMLQYVDPRIKQMESLDPKEAKKLYRLIEKTFPEFRIPKND